MSHNIEAAVDVLELDHEGGRVRLKFGPKALGLLDGAPPERLSLIPGGPLSSKLLADAIDEVLRFEPTAQYMRRVGATGVELGGVPIPEGVDVVCWIASANRDEKRWGPTANKFDITRADAPKHLAFGKGPHVCVGSWLARLELQTVIGTIISRFPNTEMLDQELLWSSNVIRGPEELVLDLKP